MKDAPDEIENAVEGLKWRFMSVADYEKGLAVGVFSKNSPEDPLAAKNRGKRMGAADIFRDYKKELPQKILDVLHEHIFDCAGPVRLSIAQALLHSGNQTSIPVLERLLDDKVASVKIMAGIVLDVLKNKVPFIRTGETIYLGEVKDGVADGKGRLYYFLLPNLIYEGEFRDNKFHGHGTYYENNKMKYLGEFRDGTFEE